MPRRCSPRVRELGAGLALDDFGAGYTSLGHLQRYRFDTLKIDRVAGAARTAPARGRRSCARWWRMAHDLGMDVIAEGAETETDAVELSQLGCEFAQGLRLRPADERRRGAQADGRRSGSEPRRRGL